MDWSVTCRAVRHRFYIPQGIYNLCVRSQALKMLQVHRPGFYFWEYNNNNMKVHDMNEESLIYRLLCRNLESERVYCECMPYLFRISQHNY